MQTDTDIQSESAHTHIYSEYQFKEQRRHLRYDSGQHQYDEEGELLTVLLVEQHQTVV